MNVEHYKMSQSFAIEYGTFLGIAWLIAFGFVVGGLTTGNLIYSLMGFGWIGLSVFIPFYLAWRFKQHLDEGECVSAFAAWVFAFLLFVYACFFAAVGHLIYFTYIDGGQLLEAFQAILTAPEVENQYTAIGASEMLETARQQLQVIQGLTPIEISLALFENNIFFSLLLTLPVAFVAHRKAVKVMIPK